MLKKFEFEYESFADVSALSKDDQDLLSALEKLHLLHLHLIQILK
jgi:hypothetical protein